MYKKKPKGFFFAFFKLQILFRHNGKFVHNLKDIEKGNYKLKNFFTAV